MSNFVDVFLQCYKEYICYNVDKSQWYWYTGKYWKGDDEYTVYNFVAKLAYEINRILKKSNADGSVLKQSISYGNDRSIKNVLEMLKTRCVCHSEDFDRCPYKLNVNNGTVNLTTKELKKHKSKDMISQFIDVDYNPDAADGRFGRFIFEICNKDQELAAYLQVLYGYAVTGETQEQKFFIEHGSGSNGKSTLNSVVSEVVGKYASQVDSSLFRKKENGSANAPTPEVAKLEKVRIVFCSETNYNELNESKIKAYTGGTKIPARALYHDSFEYMPQFTIIFDGNNMPTINGTDDGIWRRIVVIPFACRFEKDITLKDTLLSEKETILKWLIDGAYQYYQEDWPESKAVKKATDAYRAEENTVGAFIKCCYEYAGV